MMPEDDPGNGYWYQPEVGGNVGAVTQITDRDEPDDEWEGRMARKKPLGFSPWPEEPDEDACDVETGTHIIKTGNPTCQCGNVRVTPKGFPL